MFVSGDRLAERHIAQILSCIRQGIISRITRLWSEKEYGLRIMNLDDGSSTQLTSGFDNFPAWSPKGDLIVFTRLSEYDYDIYTIRRDRFEEIDHHARK
jgi:hypothetical protein